MDTSTLTNEERTAVKCGEAVPVDVDGTPCVVVRRDVFDKFKVVFDDEIDPTETYAAVLEAWDEEPDSGLDAYQEFKKK